MLKKVFRSKNAKKFSRSKKILLGLKKFFSSKKPVFRSKKSKSQVLGVKNQVIDVKSQKQIRYDSLLKHTREKMMPTKKKVNKKN